MVRRAYHNCVEIMLLFEQVAKIGKCSAAAILSRTLLASVIAFDDFLARLAPSHAAGDCKRMRQLNWLIRTEPIPSTINSKQLADRFAELVGIPLRIAHAALIGIANGDTLDVWLSQKAQHYAQPLGAHTDECDIDFVAGRNISRTAQHATGNDSDSQRRSRSLCEEIAPGHKM